ncbi:MAG: nucleotidyltransferase family protein [Candidatus Kariarchaeaceae archaeon]|jgi:molybdenum cofactor cytidylyltransferase
MSTYSVIILAAGRSERFQSNKLLAKIDNQVLIERTLQPFYQLRSKIRKILVITGTFTDELRPYIVKFGAIEVSNTDPDQGMSSSVKVGLNSYLSDPNPDTAIFIHPADTPFVETSDLTQMIEAFEKTGSSIIIPTFEGRRGHPLLISSNIIEDVVKISDDNEGMRGYLSDNQKEILYLPLSNEGILKDIDKPEDIKK